jgi:hypothetical protein
MFKYLLIHLYSLNLESGSNTFPYVHATLLPPGEPIAKHADHIQRCMIAALTVVPVAVSAAVATVVFTAVFTAVSTAVSAARRTMVAADATPSPSFIDNGRQPKSIINSTHVI